MKDRVLTVIEGANHGVVLEILPNSWEIDPHGDIELVQGSLLGQCQRPGAKLER